MKFSSLAVLALSLASTAAMAGDVGVSVTIGQPGFYGQIDIGRTPQPEVIYAQPRIIRRRGPVLEPIYLRVAPGHERNWGKYCSRYEACGRPVYFVRDDWYRRQYVEAERHQEHHERHDRDGRRDERRDDRHDRRDDDRGPGRDRDHDRH